MSRARDKANSTVSNFASTGIDDNADANAITIDSSETVLVGKTATNYQSVGVEAKANGSLWGTADGNNSLILVRKSSDGAVAQFYKDTTNVGSIGSKGGDLTIGTGVIGVRFEDSNNAIVPFDTGTLGSSDNDIDLGKSSVRWNDLYLGGNLYLGGTGSANGLDDYETGTFTATLNGGSNHPSSRLQTTGQYTKVGNKVTVSFEFNNVTTTGSPNYAGQISVFGMPFAASDPSGTVRQVSGSVASYSAATWDSASSGLFARLGDGATEWYFFANRSNDAWYPLQHSAGTNRYLLFNATYITG